ncbi:hypothetical protein GE061_015844 [Apolygus lucorum]|uniref:Uncharacterized protein n=1 Tax=Apolygus lucorum TaxID=248454 RepID=A0A8S9XPD5_APOLU|nr:hypothetical protein GE061_015844 [Apolygus lucorum]
MLLVSWKDVWNSVKLIQQVLHPGRATVKMAVSQNRMHSLLKRSARCNGIHDKTATVSDMSPALAKQTRSQGRRCWKMDHSYSSCAWLASILF